MIRKEIIPTKLQVNDQGMSREDEVVELRVFENERDEKLSREIKEVRSEIATHIYIYIYIETS